MQLGDILAELRQDRGLSQREMAELLYISASGVSAFEHNTRTPSLQILLRYANIFHVTTDYLLGLTPVSLSPTLLEKEFFGDVNYATIIKMLEMLKPEQREALLTILDNMRFYAEISNQTNRKGERQK